MNALDRIVIRAALNKHIQFDETMPNRFARIGDVRLYRPLSSGGDRWSVLFGHTSEDHGLPLGMWANHAINIALVWRSTTPVTAQEAKP